MPLESGQDFAGYTIERVLGSGGMGEVYLARHPRLPRDDALKVLGTAVSSDEEYRQRFNLEAEMVSTLHHPHIVTIYDRGDSDGQLWIAMEFVDGTDASRLLTETHPTGIPAAEVVRIVGGIADALDYAHSHHVLHRDIKPANILIGQSGASADRILLADFGVARWIGKPNNLTGADMTVGTVNYAAPEQLRGEELDGRADQYALAATTYHLLTGEPPFANSNPAIVIGHHLSSDPPKMGREDLVRFGPVFARALAKKPADRFRTCGDFARAMQDALAGPGARHRRDGSRSARGRWIAISLGGLLAGAVAAAVLVGRTHDGATGSAPTSVPPPAVSARMDLPVVVIGAECAVLGAAAVTPSGGPAYCAHATPGSDAIVWSTMPERLLRPATP
jgi:serine/threonine-protein kinase